VWLNVPNRDINKVLLLLKEGKAQQELTFESIQDDNKQKEQVEVWKQLVYSCLEFDPSKRPTAEDLVKTIKTMSTSLFTFPEQPLEAALIASSEALLKHEARMQLYETQKNRQAYIPPVVKMTDVTEDWDKFWLQFESKQSEQEVKETKEQSGNKAAASAEIQQLEDSVSQFLKDPIQSCLLLLADAGTGKSLSLHQLAERLLQSSVSSFHDNQSDNKDDKSEEWLPVFIRPALQQKWNYSSLTDAIQACMSFYHLSIQQQQSLKQQQQSLQQQQQPSLQHGVTSSTSKKKRLLFLLDGYDELNADETAKQLWTQMGLNQWPQSKLIVTCRRFVVPRDEMEFRFSVLLIQNQDQLQQQQGQQKGATVTSGGLIVRYLLPFRLQQMLDYLQKQLNWDTTTQQTYQQRFQESASLRGVLRNPFVLNLFVQSWKVIEGYNKNWNRLTRCDIYTAFVQHWLQTNQHLLPFSILQTLSTQSINHSDSTNLLSGYLRSSEVVAFAMFTKQTVILPPSWLTNSKIEDNNNTQSNTTTTAATTLPSLPNEDEKKEAQQEKKYDELSLPSFMVDRLNQDPWFQLSELIKSSASSQYQSSVQQQQQSNQTTATDNNNNNNNSKSRRILSEQSNYRD
jgi:hypothetical protein